MQVNRRLTPIGTLNAMAGWSQIRKSELGELLDRRLLLLVSAITIVANERLIAGAMDFRDLFFIVVR